MNGSSLHQRPPHCTSHLLPDQEDPKTIRFQNNGESSSTSQNLLTFPYRVYYWLNIGLIKLFCFHFERHSLILYFICAKIRDTTLFTPTILYNLPKSKPKNFNPYFGALKVHGLNYYAEIRQFCRFQIFFLKKEKDFSIIKLTKYTESILPRSCQYHIHIASEGLVQQLDIICHTQINMVNSEILVLCLFWSRLLLSL